MSDYIASGRIVITITNEETGVVVSKRRIPFEQYTPKELEHRVALKAVELTRDYIVDSGKFGLDPFNRLNLTTASLKA